MRRLCRGKVIFRGWLDFPRTRTSETAHRLQLTLHLVPRVLSYSSLHRDEQEKTRGHFNSQEKLKTMLTQNFGVSNKEHYGMLCYFLEWSSLRDRPQSHVGSCKFLTSRLSVPQGLFTWSGGPRSSGVSFFCFHALGNTKQKKLTPPDRGPPLHVNRVLVWY